VVERRLPVDTGLPDPVYDLVLVLQQALADCHRYAHFAEDARAAGDAELVELFEELTDQDRQLAGRLRGLLARRLGDGGDRAPGQP
jgi:hypothetical protein